MRIDGRPNPRHPHSTAAGPGIHPRHVRDVDDRYDLVVVGAGASGLAAAKYYQDRFGPDARILLVDPLPDFGGHSHRNEFHIHDATTGGDVMLLRNGGTVNLDSIGTWNKPANGLLDIPGSYGQPALDMLDFCGVDPDNFPSTAGPGIPSTYGLRQMLLFPKKDWGKDTLVRTKQATPDLGRVPRDDAVLARRPRGHRADHRPTRTTDWISLKHGPKTDQEKKAILARITYKRYLMDYVGVNEEATSYFQRDVARAVRGRHPGRPGRRHVGARGGRLRRARPRADDLPRHRPHRPAGHGPERRPVARLAGRQHVAAAPARLAS